MDANRMGLEVFQSLEVRQVSSGVFHLFHAGELVGVYNKLNVRTDEISGGLRIVLSTAKEFPIASA